TAPPLADGTYTATANFFAITGPLGQSATTYTLDTAGPRVTAMSPTGTINNRLSQVTVTFSKAVDPSTWTTAAIGLSGPGGAISVNPPQLVSGNTYTISFPSQAKEGVYTLTVGATVSDLAGNRMDQNQDGTNGGAAATLP